MRWIMPFCLMLMAFTPIYTTHDSTEKVDEEVRNLEVDVQSQHFTVFATTPNLTEVKDGQIVIVSSNSYNKLMWRQNQEIYAVTGSCVTVRR